MLVLSRYGLRHGVELKINWFGRLGVAPTMGAPFFAMLRAALVALIMLYVGLALAMLATAVYIRTGLDRRSVRAKSQAQLDPAHGEAILAPDPRP